MTTSTHKIHIFVSYCLITFAFSTQALAFEAWWQCASRKGGEWNFARTPSVCLVDHMLTQSFVKDQYNELIFDDSSGRDNERKRYMTELNAVAKKAADYYLKRRKPGVSQSEIDAFTTGLLTLMHQETFWSHYRKNTDGKVRYMRGDVGHGHGLMQVDDRSHQTALLQAKGADLIKNMMYGLDVFYSAWQKAPSKSCVGSSTNYKARIRAAWAAYNGGPSRLCRWTSTTGTYARHDRDFLDKLNNKRWNRYITDENATPKIDVACLAEGSSHCSTPSQPVETVVEGRLYRTTADQYCVLKGENLDCVDRLDDVNCLQIREGQIYPSASPISDKLYSANSPKLLDRNKLCMEQVEGLIALTSDIQLLKNINMRRTPGGVLVKTIPSGTQLSNLDFRLRTTQDQKRYYKVSHNGSTGYVYAGDMHSYDEWIIPSEVPSPVQVVANVGDTVKIVGPYGLNIRQTPGGSLIGNIPTGDTVEVLEKVVQGSKNYLYYRVSHANGAGYIYSGYLDDMDSIDRWTEVIVDRGIKLYQLSDTMTYKSLKACADASCDYNDQIVLSKTGFGSQSTQLVVKDTQGEWSHVESLDKRQQGWILTRQLQPIN